MNVRMLTAISVITVAGAAAGCSDQTEDRSETANMAPEQREGAPAATPSGSDRERIDALSQTPQQAPMGQPADEPPQTVEASEFASFDTDSNGRLGEDEWEANATENATNLRNMTFAQIDRDASGDIDLQEFRKAKVQDSSAEQTGSATEGLDTTP
jgi:hypothetical protein